MPNPLGPITPLPLVTAGDVRDTRRRLGLSQAAFAARLGVSVQAVRHWEQGLRTPTGLYAKALLDLMATDPSTGSGQPRR